ncbi:MAG: glycosyltransferase family 1 protein [Pseudomonadota bacterium]
MRESPSILLDISRTVARARLPAPTGIDRVERAYIRWASLRGGRFLGAFDGRQYLLEVDAVGDLLGWIEDGDDRPSLDLRGYLQVQRDLSLRTAQSLVRRMARAVASPAGVATMLREHMPGSGLYLNVGHDNLDAALMASLTRAGFGRAAMVHDTIPLDHPAFARHGTVETFRAKLNAAFRADLLLANSQDTADRMRGHGAEQQIVTAPLGIDPVPAAASSAPPAFLVLGTIEPRKNHALLLRIWRALWDQMGEASPRLTILGRRGWENRAVFDLLDSEPMMGRTVIEAGTPNDDTLAEHLASATALLFPSHAEGYGLPMAEALAAGVPVIASDLPALREVGGEAAEYLEPSDVETWKQRVLDYAALGSPQRAARVAAIGDWQAPTWAQHFRIIENAIETILVQGRNDV